MTDERKMQLEKKLLGAARSMLSMQVGLALGALRLCELLRQLGEAEARRYPVFADFVAALPPGLPVGTARLYWAPARLMACDAQLASLEASFRRALLLGCIAIIETRGLRNMHDSALPSLMSV